VERTSRFNADFERMRKRGKDVSKLRPVISALANRRPLDPKYRDHALTGNLKGIRDCHIEPDWVLLYFRESGSLILTRTGSHSDLGL
jgi:mRNA interferase YafQ